MACFVIIVQQESKEQSRAGTERGERRAGSFCYKATPEQPDDDVTALNYPWCFAGKMNEVRRGGEGGGVNEDTHSHFICILIMCGDSYTSTDDNKKKKRKRKTRRFN